jgi:uncharacterized protein YdeI (YjbR/CyaY-like superfamily)
MVQAPENSIHPETRTVWRSWLEQNHTQTQGIWLISYKKGSGKPRFDYEEAVEEALCFGWIDSKPNKLDEERSLLWFAPRKPKTGWSKMNKDRVERLIQQGLMMPPGLAKVEVAKADGSWNALDAIEALEIPPDLAAALTACEAAKTNFEAFPKSVKRGILEWIAAARKPETRAKRIEQTAQLASENKRANQWRGQDKP